MKKTLIFFLMIFMSLCFAACEGDNAIPKNYVPVADKDAYEIIDLTYPDEVAQGESFEVVIKAKNSARKRLYRETNSTMLDKNISVIIYNDSYTLFDGIIAQTDDRIVKKIEKNEEIESTWSFDGTLAIDWQSDTDPYERDIAPQGTYSIKLSTGLILTDVLVIV